MLPKFLCIIDILSIEPKIMYFGNSRFKTWFGGLFSILSIIAILVLSFYFCLKTLGRDSTTIVYNQDATIYPTLNISKFSIMISLVDGNAQPLTEQERYWGLMVELWEFDDELKNGTLQNKQTINQIKFKKCDLQTDFGEYAHYFDNATHVSDYYCIVPNQNNLTLYGVYGDSKPQSFLYFYINRCMNGYDGKSNCHPMTKINNALINTYISLRYIDYDVLHNNQKTPYRPYMRTEGLPISSTIYKRFFINKKNVEYTTDYELVFDDSRVENFHQQDNIDVSVDSRRLYNYPDRLANINIQMSRKTDLYYKTYSKLQDLVANIGGVIESILIIANFVVSFFSQSVYNLNLVNKLFDYNEPASNSNSNIKMNHMVSNAGDPQ